jgi:hypothetical protein
LLYPVQPGLPMCQSLARVIRMIDEKEVSTTKASAPARATNRAKIYTIISGLGLGLVILAGLAWLVTFPTLRLLQATLTGDLSLFQPGRPLSLPETFFRQYPQLLWFGFILGALIFFGFRPGSYLPRELPANPGPFKLGGKTFDLPAWTGLAWRLTGICALVLVLALAAALRIDNARSIGATDLVRTDYDEGVHSTAALLMSQGKSIYQDFFLTQPPVGPFIWSLPLRLSGTEWGGLLEFLQLRFFTSILALLTITLVYLSGRRLGGRWGGPLAGSVAAFTLAIDGSAVRTEQQIMLEPLVNLFTAAAIFAFVHLSPDQTQKSRRWYAWPLLAGLLAGVALSIKIPALAIVLGLALSLVAWRYWKALGLYLGGAVGGYLLATGAFILSARSELIKEAYLYQLLRPFNDLATTGEFQSETTLTAYDYLARTPYLAFTILAAALGLVAILLRWLTRSGGETWLPVTLVAALTALLYTGKAGFFPHYYDHLALPLALLAGGVVNFKFPKSWRFQWRLASGVIVAAGLALFFLPAARFALSEPSLPQWSQERAVDNNFNSLALSDNGTLLTWDTRYSFIMGQPLVTDNHNKYVVDSAAYVEYLALDLEHQDLATVARKALLDKKNNDLRHLRYLPVVQTGLYQTAQKSDFILLEARADSQLTKETISSLKSNFINRLDTADIDIYVNQQDIGYRSGAVFGGKIQLVGFDTTKQIKISPQEHKVPLTIYWRGTARIEEDYVIFFHLLNEKDEVVAQRDTAPRYGNFNTSKWVPNELFDDDQSLEVPATLPQGRYRIELGIYRPSDGTRLKVTQPAPGQRVTPGGDSLILFEVNIVGL